MMLETFTQTIRGRINRPLQYYLDTCVRCGACIDACHFYAASHDPAHIPAYRMMLVKKLMQGGDFDRVDLRNWWRATTGFDAAAPSFVPLT
jgi:Fe-S oxidoreductase